MMNNQKIYDMVDVVMENNKKARESNDFLGLLMNGQTLLNAVNTLIKISVENESSYRKYEAELALTPLESGKLPSGAFCETQAKATDYYKEWQKSIKVIELCYHLSNMAKRLASDVGKDLTAQH